MYTFTLNDGWITGTTVLVLIIILTIWFLVDSAINSNRKVKKLDKEVSKKNQELTDLSELFNSRSEKRVKPYIKRRP